MPRVIQSSEPVGKIIACATSITTPYLSGYFPCEGQAISRTGFPALFAVIGTAHGSGDGVSTFNLPDYRGRFLRGWDALSTRDPDRATRTAMNPGGATGDNVGSVQGDQFASHGHSYYQGPAVGGTLGGAAWGNTDSGLAAGTNSVGGNETRPKNAYVRYWIKY